MSLVFRENAKNRQNHVFEGAVMGVRRFLGLLFLGSIEFCDHQVSLTKRIKYLSFKTKKSLIFKVKELRVHDQGGVVGYGGGWRRHLHYSQRIVQAI